MNPATQSNNNTAPITTPRIPTPTFTPDIDWGDPLSIREFVRSLDAPMYAPCMAEVGDGMWGIWFVGRGFEG